VYKISKLTYKSIIIKVGWLNQLEWGHDVYKHFKSNYGFMYRGVLADGAFCVNGLWKGTRLVTRQIISIAQTQIRHKFNPCLFGRKVHNRGFTDYVHFMAEGLSWDLLSVALKPFNYNLQGQTAINSNRNCTFMKIQKQSVARVVIHGGLVATMLLNLH
jgi:hypothetical protein